MKMKYFHSLQSFTLIIEIKFNFQCHEHVQSWWMSPQKFISNNKELVLSIPESQRRNGVRDQDLSGQLPNEKALAICWHIGVDSLTFQIKLNERPLTLRLMLSGISSIYGPLGFAALFALEGFFRAFVSRMCNRMLKFPMMCSKAEISEKGS